jgi:hypothetical protein
MPSFRVSVPHRRVNQINQQEQDFYEEIVDDVSDPDHAYAEVTQKCALDI